MITVRDIYNAIDRKVPFSTAEKWDNCGLLAGDPYASVTRIITALDITCDAVREAEEKGAELIISHHPVIFTPMKSVTTDTVTGMLLRKNISAVCTHTPFDMADCGMNKGLYNILSGPLGLSQQAEPLEITGENTSIGMIYELNEQLMPSEIAARLKKALGCTCLRYIDTEKPVKRVAVSSGSGNSLAALSASKGADAFISGDFKHDVLIDAKNTGFAIFDCGHFHTERIFCRLMRELLKEEFPELDIIEAESCTDPVKYI